MATVLPMEKHQWLTPTQRAIAPFIKTQEKTQIREVYLITTRHHCIVLRNGSAQLYESEKEGPK